MGNQSQPVEEVDERVGYTGPEYAGTRANGYYWLMGRDDNDLIGQMHYRKVNSFVCGDVETVTPGGGADVSTEPFVRLTVCGDSFMLYQIRKMIATAVAVTLGYIPASFVPVTLARPARTATPLAPASTLYLRNIEFFDFRKTAPENAKDDQDQPPRMVRLKPAGRVAEEISAFQRDVLDPSLVPALSGPEWDVFLTNLPKLRSTNIPEVLEELTALNALYQDQRGKTIADSTSEREREVEGFFGTDSAGGRGTRRPEDPASQKRPWEKTENASYKNKPPPSTGFYGRVKAFFSTLSGKKQ